MKNLYEEVIIAGFGGQGIMLIGKLLAQTAMEAGMEVTYMPSYGAEVRGGTANCMVVVADATIASPVISKPSSLVIMNKASMEKFVPRLKDGGLLIINSSLIEEEPDVSSNTHVLPIPADDIAVKLKNPKSANMVILGAYLQRLGALTADQAGKSLGKVLSKRYHKLLDVNCRALQKGAEFAQQNAG